MNSINKQLLCIDSVKIEFKKSYLNTLSKINLSDTSNSAIGLKSELILIENKWNENFNPDQYFRLKNEELLA